jgi:xylan 1,4-beta-xylosidase
MTAADATFIVDAGAEGELMRRSWELAVGAGDAWSLLRADVQDQLRRAVNECGFRYLRCHGVLSDQMQVVRRDRDGRLVYNWRLVDAAYDALLAVGMKPFVELGFMPAALASGDQAVFFYRANVTPPADYDAWRDFITALVTHWQERYGSEETRSWYYEIWNEANLRGFWSSTMEEYFRLYDVTARAIKAVDPSLRVGGPATTRAEWLPEFLAFCSDRGVPLDFASIHIYPDDDDFGKVDPGYRQEFERGGYLEKVVAQATLDISNIQRANSAPSLEVHWTEWNSSWRWGRLIHDISNQAAYLCRALHGTFRRYDSFAYWTISDIFNEFPFPRSSFVGGFGLITIDGIPKPGYHAYALLHRLGERELPVRRPDGDAEDAWAGCLDLWAARSANGRQLLLSNYTQPGLESADLAPRSVDAYLTGLRPGVRYDSVEYRVDRDNANGRSAWEQMGSPETPTPSQLEELKRAAELRATGRRRLTAEHDGTAQLRADLPPASVVFYEITES